ncbi:MAG: hypothetical protein ABIY55_20070 [Kofleriaceae bacterium]
MKLLARGPVSLLVFALIAGAALTGCYDAIFIPKVAQPKLPELREGVEIETSDEVVKSRGYHFNREGEWVHKRTRLGDASYGDQKLTWAQLSALGDPEWNTKLDHLRDLRSTCRRGAIPQVIGYTSAIAMAVVGGLTSYTHTSGDPRSEREALALNTAYGLGGVTAVAYGVGFLLGGHACPEAARYRSSELRLDSKEVLFSGSEVEMVHTMASQFNAHRVPAAAEARVE